MKRTVDELGRIVLPAELLMKAKIKKKDKIAVNINKDGNIIISKCCPVHIVRK